MGIGTFSTIWRRRLAAILLMTGGAGLALPQDARAHSANGLNPMYIVRCFRWSCGSITTPDWLPPLTPTTGIPAFLNAMTNGSLDNSAGSVSSPTYSLIPDHRFVGELVNTYVSSRPAFPSTEMNRSAYCLGSSSSLPTTNNFSTFPFRLLTRMAAWPGVNWRGATCASSFNLWIRSRSTSRWSFKFSPWRVAAPSAALAASVRAVAIWPSLSRWTRPDASLASRAESNVAPTAMTPVTNATHRRTALQNCRAVVLTNCIDGRAIPPIPLWAWLAAYIGGATGLFFLVMQITRQRSERWKRLVDPDDQRSNRLHGGK